MVRRVRAGEMAEHMVRPHLFHQLPAARQPLRFRRAQTQAVHPRVDHHGGVGRMFRGMLRPQSDLIGTVQDGLQHPLEKQPDILRRGAVQHVDARRRSDGLSQQHPLARRRHPEHPAPRAVEHLGRPLEPQPVGIRLDARPDLRTRRELLQRAVVPRHRRRVDQHQRPGRVSGNVLAVRAHGGGSVT